MSYLQSPYALPFAVAIVVAIVRRLAPRIDGPYLVLSCAVLVGAALGVVQALAFGGPLVEAIIAGFAAGFVAFGGHDLLAGLLSKAGPVTIGSSNAPQP